MPGVGRPQPYSNLNFHGSDPCGHFKFLAHPPCRSQPRVLTVLQWGPANFGGSFRAQNRQTTDTNTILLGPISVHSRALPPGAYGPPSRSSGGEMKKLKLVKTSFNGASWIQPLLPTALPALRRRRRSSQTLCWCLGSGRIPPWVLTGNSRPSKLGPKSVAHSGVASARL